MGASIQSNVHSGQASTRASIQNEGDRPAVAQPLPRRTRRLPHLRGRNEAQTCFACSLPQRQPVRHGDLTQRPPLASGMRPPARTSYTPSERRRRRTRQSSESAASPFLSCSANAQGRRLTNIPPGLGFGIPPGLPVGVGVRGRCTGSVSG